MANTKLTDAQRVILAAAAAREGGLVLPLPTSLGDNRGTLGVILKSLLTRGLVTERPILPDEEIWRETTELGRATLVISVEGLQLMGIDPIDEVIKNAEGIIVAGPGGTSPEGGRPELQFDNSLETISLPKESSKLGAVIAALRKPEGATIAELMQATGWQAHSVRGAISGNLKKKLNLNVVSEKVDDRGRTYRIAPAGTAA